MINIPIPRIEDLVTARSDLSDIEFVDTGGFKVVFKAKVKRAVEAVKLVYLPPPSETDEGDDRSVIVARVKREIGALERCQTECLVRLGTIQLEPIRVGSHDYLLYSEEFVPGTSLRQRIKAKYCPAFTELKALSRSLMLALDAINSIGHIHRDVKPGNVMATGNPKRPFVLLDLGIAYKVHGTDLTQKGGIMGTTRYMAPEVFGSNYKDTLDIRADMYSAGVTVFEYAAGEHPIASRGEDQRTTIYRILYQPSRKLKELRSDLPGSFCDMIDRCIKKLPALRFSTPTAVLSRLEEIR